MTDEADIEVIDQRTGKPADLSVLEDTGVAFDPSTAHLELTKEEKRRTTALMLAVQAYKELIIKDADYLREVADQNRRNDGPAIKPATIDGMVEAAWKFDLFISGRMVETEEPTRGGMQTEAQAGEDGGFADTANHP